jgi:hypothetical protein
VTITYDGTDADLAEKLEAANAALVGKIAQAKLKTKTDEFPDAPKYVEGEWSQERIDQESLKFLQSTPEYVGTAASFQALVQFMSHHNLAMTAANCRLMLQAPEIEGDES